MDLKIASHMWKPLTVQSIKHFTQEVINAKKVRYTVTIQRSLKEFKNLITFQMSNL